MEHIDSRALAKEIMRLFRLCFLAARNVDACNPEQPRANSLHYHVLFILLNHPNPDLSMSQLAAATCSSKQQLSKLIGVMEGKGLVRREHDPVNRRRVYVRILPAGKAMVDEAFESMHEKIVQVLEVFSEQEKLELHDSFMLYRRLLPKLFSTYNNSSIQEEA